MYATTLANNSVKFLIHTFLNACWNCGSNGTVLVQQSVFISRKIWISTWRFVFNSITIPSRIFNKKLRESILVICRSKWVWSKIRKCVYTKPREMKKIRLKIIVIGGNNDTLSNHLSTYDYVYVKTASVCKWVCSQRRQLRHVKWK